jgi:hypothetical protein
VSQINPFRGVVVPSARPQGVQVQKDRRERKPPHDQPRDQDEEKGEQPNPPPQQDGKPHVDVKA